MSAENNFERQQYALDYIVKKYIAPTMRNLDFKKKNRKFTKKEDPYMKELKVYSSQWNTWDDVSFAIELNISSIEHKDQEIYKELVSTRIKNKEGKEKWYELNSFVQPDALGKEIVQDILDNAVPFFEKY